MLVHTDYFNFLHRNINVRGQNRNYPVGLCGEFGIKIWHETKFMISVIFIDIAANHLKVFNSVKHMGTTLLNVNYTKPLENRSLGKLKIGWNNIIGMVHMSLCFEEEN
jgi:hypothetical protein